MEIDFSFMLAFFIFAVVRWLLLLLFALNAAFDGMVESGTGARRLLMFYGWCEVLRVDDSVRAYEIGSNAHNAGRKKIKQNRIVTSHELRSDSNLSGRFLLLLFDLYL